MKDDKNVIYVPPTLLKLFPVMVVLGSIIAGFAASHTTVQAQERRLSRVENNESEIDKKLNNIAENVARVCEKVQAKCQ